MNMPLFMDNSVQNALSSTNMPLFMDNSVQNPLSSIKLPLFMDNLVHKSPLIHGTTAFLQHNIALKPKGL